MQSIRVSALARSLPRSSIPRISASRAFTSASLRPSSSLLLSSSKSTPQVQSQQHILSSLRASAPFSTSQLLQKKQGEIDDELVAKFDSELRLENEIRDSSELPVGVKDFIENGPFELHDKPGQEEVVLTRQFGNENIRVAFSISDLHAMGENPENDFDPAQYDEEEDEGSLPSDTQSGGAQSKNTVNAGRTSGGNVAVAPEDSVSPSDRSAHEAAEAEEDEIDEDGQEPSFPARVAVTVTKSDAPGALHLETSAQDGSIVIDGVSWHADTATVPVAGGVGVKETDAYLGPPFGNLDEDLQVLMERYLEERGVNTALALFIPDYIDFKEQREYLAWLNSVRSFVEA